MHEKLPLGFWKNGEIYLVREGLREIIETRQYMNSRQQYRIRLSKLAQMVLKLGTGALAGDVDAERFWRADVREGVFFRDRARNGGVEILPNRDSV